MARQITKKYCLKVKKSLLSLA